MHTAIIHRTTPLLLAAVLLLSVFPTAGHFHVCGSRLADVPTVQTHIPTGADRHQSHDPFHCTIHLIAASFASIEQSAAVGFPTLSDSLPASRDHITGARPSLSTPDVRGPPVLS